MEAKILNHRGNVRHHLGINFYLSYLVIEHISTGHLTLLSPPPRTISSTPPQLQQALLHNYSLQEYEILQWLLLQRKTAESLASDPKSVCAITGQESSGPTASPSTELLLASAHQVKICLPMLKLKTNAVPGKPAFPIIINQAGLPVQYIGETLHMKVHYSPLRTMLFLFPL